MQSLLAFPSEEEECSGGKAETERDRQRFRRATSDGASDLGRVFIRLLCQAAALRASVPAGVVSKTLSCVGVVIQLFGGLIAHRAVKHSIDKFLDFATCCTRFTLDHANELVGIALDSAQVVISELSPMFFEAAFDFIPVALELFTVWHFGVL